MRLFRRRKKVKQDVGGKDVAIDERLVASIKEAMQKPAPKPRRSRWVFDARKELERVNKEEAERKK